MSQKSINATFLTVHTKGVQSDSWWKLKLGVLSVSQNKLCLCLMPNTRAQTRTHAALFCSLTLQLLTKKKKL